MTLRCSFAIRFSLLAALTSAGGGCWLIPLGAENPYLPGPWVGKITTVKVYERDGKEHLVAALIIESGPVLKSSDPDFQANTVILAEPTNNLNRTLDPATLPVGHRVRITGRMADYNVFLAGEVRTFTRKRLVVDCENRVSLDQLDKYEPVILMSGRPVVLDD